MFSHGIMFHHFHSADGGNRGGRHPASQGSISAHELGVLIGFLGLDRILPATEWQRRAVAGELREGDVCLTFDDNLRCQYDIARPVLADGGITAFWFIYSSALQGGRERIELYRQFRTVHFETVGTFYAAFFEAVGRFGCADEMERTLRSFDASDYLADYPFYTEADRRFRYVRDEVLGSQRYHAVMDDLMASMGVDVDVLARDLWMDDECVRQLHADGHVIGLHSHTHPTRLGELSYEAQREEYRANHAHLTQLLGTPPVAMSHPCNSYNDDTFRVLRELGIQLGFRSNMAQRRRCELDYPREDHTNLMARMRA